jgi:hypothetical protein
MSLKGSQFRKLEPNVDLDLRGGGWYTLILIQIEGATYGNTVRAKDLIVSEFKESGGLLLLAWQGQYKTDVFHLTMEELEKNYDMDRWKKFEEGRKEYT